MYLDDLKSYRLEAVADKHDENLDLSKSRFTQCLVKLLGPTRSLVLSQMKLQSKLNWIVCRARPDVAAKLDYILGSGHTPIVRNYNGQ